MNKFLSLLLKTIIVIAAVWDFFLNWGSPAGAFGFCDTLPFMGVYS